MKTTKFILTALLFVGAITTFQSCKDHDDDHDDDHGVTVNIVSPVEGNTYDEKDTLWLKVDFSSTEDIHDYSLTIKNLTKDTVVYFYGGHSHSTSLSTNLWYLPQVDANSNMQLIVENMDHDGNKKQTTRNFIMNNTIENGPEITITKPTGTETASNGTVVAIAGLLKSNNTLKSASIVVTKEGETAPKFSYNLPVSGLKEYTMDTAYTINTGGQMHNDFVFTFTATDNNNKSSTKTVNLHVHE